MSTTVNETCACGARFEFRGDWGMTAASAFRKAHAECRRAAEASCGGCGCADRLRAEAERLAREDSTQFQRRNTEPEMLLAADFLDAAQDARRSDLSDLRTGGEGS